MSDSASGVADLVATRESFTLAEAACAWVGVPLSLARGKVRSDQWARYPGKYEEAQTVLDELVREAAKGPHGSLELGAPIVRQRVVNAGKVYEVNLGTGGERLVDGRAVEFWIDFASEVASRQALQKFADSRGVHPPFLFPPGAIDPGAKGRTEKGEFTVRRLIGLLASLLAAKAQGARFMHGGEPNASAIAREVDSLAMTLKLDFAKEAHIRELISQGLKSLEAADKR